MLPDSTVDGNWQEIQAPDTEELIRANHNVPREAIIRVIQNSLGPLEVDPVPRLITIDNIVITRNSRNELTISCDVSYKTRL